MSSQVYLPIGTKENKKSVLVSKGDILQLVTGEKVTFESMRRTKFTCLYNGRELLVPVYRNKRADTPFVTEKLGVDKEYLAKKVSPSKLKAGDLFYIDGYKESFLFKETFIKSGKQMIKAIDLASEKPFNIDPSCTLIKIDLNKLKKQLTT